MLRRGMVIAALCLAMPAIGLPQVSNSARSEIIRSIFSEEASVRVDMPLGGEGLQLSDQGEINESKLNKELQKNGRSIQAG